VQDTVGEVIAAIPKPRGEGAWAWCRYYLIRALRSWDGERYTCPVPGCPYAPWPSKYHRGPCERHMSAEDREWFENRLAASRAEIEGRKAAGEVPRRTFCQWLGINRPLR